MGPEGSDFHTALRYMAMLRAARDFGLRAAEIEVLARGFDYEAGLDVLADRLTDAVLARAELDELLSGAP
jgi:hypothetical protein